MRIVKTSLAERGKLVKYLVREIFQPHLYSSIFGLESALMFLFRILFSISVRNLGLVDIVTDVIPFPYCYNVLILP